MKKHLFYKIVCISLLVAAIAGISLSTSVSAQTASGSNTGGTGSGSNVGGSGTGGNLGGSGAGSNTQTSVFYLQNPLDSKFNTVGGIINGFVDIFTYLVILLAVLMIIYVGFRFVLAQGNVEELKERKNQLLWLLVGVAIVIGARLLISLVLNTLQATGVIDSGVINNAQNAIRGQ